MPRNTGREAGRGRQAIYRRDHKAACKGWCLGGLPCEEAACPCCEGLCSRPLLPDPVRLSLSCDGMAGRVHELRGRGVPENRENQSHSRFTCVFYRENRMPLGLPECTGVFRARIRQLGAVWMRSAEVDALFRLKPAGGYANTHFIPTKNHP